MGCEQKGLSCHPRLQKPLLLVFSMCNCLSEYGSEIRFKHENI